jgi:hypothetical protein
LANFDRLPLPARLPKKFLPPVPPWVIQPAEETETMALIISEPQTRKLIDMSAAVKLVDKIFRDRAAGKMRNVPR